MCERDTIWSINLAGGFNPVASQPCFTSNYSISYSSGFLFLSPAWINIKQKTQTNWSILDHNSMKIPNFEWYSIMIYNDAVSIDAHLHPSPSGHVLNPRTGAGALFFGAALAALGILPFGWFKWIKAKWIWFGGKADFCNDSKYMQVVYLPPPLTSSHLLPTNHLEITLVHDICRKLNS